MFGAAFGLFGVPFELFGAVFGLFGMPFVLPPWFVLGSGRAPQCNFQGPLGLARVPLVSPAFLFGNARSVQVWPGANINHLFCALVLRKISCHFLRLPREQPHPSCLAAVRQDCACDSAVKCVWVFPLCSHLLPAAQQQQPQRIVHCVVHCVALCIASHCVAHCIVHCVVHCALHCALCIALCIVHCIAHCAPHFITVISHRLNVM